MVVCKQGEARAHTSEAGSETRRERVIRTKMTEAQMVVPACRERWWSASSGFMKSEPSKGKVVKVSRMCEVA